MKNNTVKIIIAFLISFSIIFSSYLMTGGLYKVDTIQLGIVHRINIFSGEISMCALDKGCKMFSNKEYLTNSNKIRQKNESIAIYPLSHIRKKFPEYDDTEDDKLANALYRKYLSESKLLVSKKSFFEVIGYTE